MQRSSPTDIIPVIINTLRDGKQTVSRLSKKTKINRVTLAQYIKAFENAGIITSIKHGRERYIQLRSNPDSHFDLPIKEEDNKTLSTIYAYIKETCIKLYNKEPTKTQVYKILFELKKPLPIGWYQHGPCAVRIYRGNEKKQITLSKEDRALIEEKVREYCRLTSYELQKKIYSKENNRLYLIKERLLRLERIKRDELNILLTELLQAIPKEANELAADFVRAALLLGWEKTHIIFRDNFWKYVAMITFRESLREYYGDSIDEYLKDRIEQIREDTKKHLYYMVKEYMDSKYSGDKHYEQYVKMHQNHHLR